jgi:hypothetical protein
MPGQRGTTLHRARRLTTKVGVVPVDDLVQMLADGLWVCGAGDRQDVLEQVMPKEISDAQRLSRYSNSGAVCSVNSSASGLKVWLSAGWQLQR